MSKIKNSELDQYGAKPFEQQQFGTAGVEGVKLYAFDNCSINLRCSSCVIGCTFICSLIYRGQHEPSRVFCSQKIPFEELLYNLQYVLEDTVEANDIRGSLKDSGWVISSSENNEN